MAPFDVGNHANATDSGVAVQGGTVTVDTTSAAITSAKNAFGLEEGDVSVDGNTITITLSKNIIAENPIKFVKGTSGKKVVVDLNGKTITGKAGTNHGSYTLAKGGNAIEIIPADFDVEIKGSGKVIGGEGTYYETISHMRYGADGGMAVCFVANEGGSYWNPSNDDAKLTNGLIITSGAEITGGAGASLSGDDWVYNIANYDGEKKYAQGDNPQFEIRAGVGGAGIGQADAGIEYGATSLAYSKIEIENGIVNGGKGGELNFNTENSPVLTHFGLMNSPAIDQYMKDMPGDNSKEYDDKVAGRIKYKTGNGGDGLVIGAGRKYVCVEQNGTIKGGGCGDIEYGRSKWVNQIGNEQQQADSGNGIAVYGDIGLKNVDVQKDSWKTAGKDSGDMGIYIAGSVEGGDSPHADAMHQCSGNGGKGLMVQAEKEFISDNNYQRLPFPDGEDYVKYGIISVSSEGAIKGGNGGSAIDGKAGHGGDGIREDYTKGDGPSDSIYGTDYYQINGQVNGGNGGYSATNAVGAGGEGITFGNYRKDVNVSGSGTACGGNQGNGSSGAESVFNPNNAKAVRFFPEDLESCNNSLEILEQDGKAGVEKTISDEGMAVKVNMTSFNEHPSTSTKLTAEITGPAGYTGDIYVKWFAKIKLQTNPEVVCAIEPSGTDATSFNLQSNATYKYLAYPTYPSYPDLGSTYNVNVATTDRIKDNNKNNDSYTEIYCIAQLEDGRRVKSNVMHFTKTGWNGGSGGNQGQDQIDQAAADRVEALIDNLPNANDITLAHEAQIIAARNAYEALTDAQKALLAPYTYLFDKLEAAEQKIVELKQKEEEDIAAAGAVEELIDALDNLDVESIDPADEDALNEAKEQIEEAKTAYDNLTDDQKYKLDPDAITKLTEIINSINEKLDDNDKIDVPDAPSYVDISTATVSTQSVTYNGKARTPAVTVKDGNTILIKDRDYTLTYGNNVKAGNGKVIIVGKGKYTGKKETTFKINKAKNSLMIKGKTTKIKYRKLKKKAQTLAISKTVKFVRKGQGKMSYKLYSAKKGKKNFKKYFKINAKTGKTTIKKKLKKGTYKVVIKAQAAGDANYNISPWNSATFKVRIK